MRKLHIFYNDYTNWHSKQNCNKVSFFPSLINTYYHILNVVILKVMSWASHWDFDLYFPDDKWFWASVHVSVCGMLWGKNVYSLHLPLLKSCLSFCVGNLRSSVFWINFKFLCSTSVKNTIGSLIRIKLNL